MVANAPTHVLGWDWGRGYQIMSPTISSVVLIPVLIHADKAVEVLSGISSW